MTVNSSRQFFFWIIYMHSPKYFKPNNFSNCLNVSVIRLLSLDYILKYRHDMYLCKPRHVIIFNFFDNENSDAQIYNRIWSLSCCFQLRSNPLSVKNNIIDSAIIFRDSFSPIVKVAARMKIPAVKAKLFTTLHLIKERFSRFFQWFLFRMSQVYEVAVVRKNLKWLIIKFFTISANCFILAFVNGFENHAVGFFVNRANALAPIYWHLPEHFQRLRKRLHGHPGISYDWFINKLTIRFPV